MLEYLSTKHLAYLPQASGHDRLLGLKEHMRFTSWNVGNFILVLNTQGDVLMIRDDHRSYLTGFDHPVTGIYGRFTTNAILWDVTGQLYQVRNISPRPLITKLPVQFPLRIVRVVEYGTDAYVYLLADGGLHVYHGGECQTVIPGNYKEIYTQRSTFFALNLRGELYRYIPDRKTLILQAKGVVLTNDSPLQLSWIDDRGHWHWGSKTTRLLPGIPKSFSTQSYGGYVLLYVDGEIWSGQWGGKEWRGTFPDAVAVNIDYRRRISYYTANNHLIYLKTCSDGKLR